MVTVVELIFSIGMLLCAGALFVFALMALILMIRDYREDWDGKRRK